MSEGVPATIALARTQTNFIHESLSDIVRSRHSTRAFKPDLVDRSIIEESLGIAQHAASNSNIQPWRVTILEGDALARLEKSLLAAVDAKEVPEIKPIPEEYKKYRSDMGHSLYGPDGYNIPRGSREEMEHARRRNYTFFDAPMAVIVSMDNKLATVDVLSVGLYIQTLVLLLQERGVRHCIEVSVAGYPKAIRKELGLPENQDVLCGIAIGYEDEEKQVNKLVMSRDDWRKDVRFLKE